MFDAMAKMGMVQEFIKMVKLFKDARKVVSLNGCITKSFKTESGLGKVARTSSLPSLSHCRGSFEFHVQRGYQI
jgi:hypothetical protein